jgi:tripartite-type tricarboxylate transporter receptor subunit TctC
MKPFRASLYCALGLALVSFEAGAQTWPTRPIRVIVPFAAGTITDIVPRLVLEQVSAQLGQTITVENRPGAGGTTSAAAVAKAEPDGYTVLVNSSAHTIAPALYSNLGYDPTTDFAAVAPLGIVPSVLVVSPASQFRRVGDFVAAAKAKPGAMNFGSAGIGTATYLSAMRFQTSTGMQAVHIPFKGGPVAMKEIIAGRLDFFFAPVGNALPLVKDGLLTALVVNGERRSAALPEVPTTSEAGIVGAEYPFWIGMFLPSQTPRAIVDRLHSEVTKALTTPPVRSRLEALGGEAMTRSPSEMDEFVRKQVVADAVLAKTANINPQ